jgi:c-di-GMP phosphodiesterase
MVRQRSAVISTSIIIGRPMLRFLASLFKRQDPTLDTDPKAAAKAAAYARAFARLNNAATFTTRAAAMRAPVPGRAVLPFVCREVVLNRDERIAGYEFSLDGLMQARYKGRDPGIRKMYDELLMRELARIDAGSLLGQRLAMMEITSALTEGHIPSNLPRENTIIFLSAAEEEGQDASTMVKRIDALANAGFQVGWNLQDAGELSSVALARCHFVRIEMPMYDGLQLKELARKIGQFNRSGDHTRVRIIARDIQTFDDFQICFRAGFDFFQGPFIVSRKSWKIPKNDVDRVCVFRLLRRLRSGADRATLAADLRTEPVLTYRLLRYINSAVFGLQRRIGSIDEALLLIGVDKLYRWLTLLLFDIKDRGYAERAIIEQVLVRARTMELLSKYPVDPDLAFLTGLLSMLDQFVGRPIIEVIPQINVPHDVKAALLTQTGPYAPLLDLAMICERGDQACIAAAAARCGVDETIVNTTLIAALNWANETAAISD